jgi:hypothetical protein
MIAFTCQQCGRRFDRPAEQSGTLVFCECGTGNRVPWESTLPALSEPPLAEPADDAPAPRWSAAPEQVPRVQAVAQHRAYCLNHPGTAAEQTCADCGVGFCSACIVSVQGALRCGPCKNFRARAVQRPPRLSALALLAPIVALVAGAVWLFVLLVAAGQHPNSSSILTVGALGLLPQVAAFIMGAAALRKVETDPRLGGRAPAITGMISAVACSAVLVQLTVLALRVAS